MLVLLGILSFIIMLLFAFKFNIDLYVNNTKNFTCIYIVNIH